MISDASPYRTVEIHKLPLQPITPIHGPCRSILLLIVDWKLDFFFGGGDAQFHLVLLLPSRIARSLMTSVMMMSMTTSGCCSSLTSAMLCDVHQLQLPLTTVTAEASVRYTSSTIAGFFPRLWDRESTPYTRDVVSLYSTTPGILHSPVFIR